MSCHKDNVIPDDTLKKQANHCDNTVVLLIHACSEEEYYTLPPVLHSNSQEKGVYSLLQPVEEVLYLRKCV